MQLKNIAIVEIASHEECIYSQVQFLTKAGYKVHFIGNEKLKERVARFGFASETYLGYDAIQKSNIAFAIKRIIRAKNTDCVIFNTAQGNVVRNVSLLMLFSKVRFVGVMHNVKKLHKSFSQKIINLRIKKYFVLNSYIEASQQKLVPHLQLKTFYPIFFASYKPVKVEKKAGETWLCVPGKVELFRKDYLGFLQMLGKMQSIPENLKIIFLGNCPENSKDGARVLEMISQYNLGKSVVLFHKFVSDSLFHAYLEASDFIVPLLHPGHSNFEDFATSKISGAFNLGFHYRKPFLIHDRFKNYDDFKQAGVFYNRNTFADTLTNIASEKLHPPKSLYTSKKWSFEFQQKNYVDFIEAE